MRPGGLERRGLGYEELREVNPKIVFCTISGYGMTGPYRDMPSHGIAYDTWAGIVAPKVDEDGFAYMPEHVSIGINAGPLFGALGILAGVIRARETGEGCQLEIAQSDAAAAIDWLRSETWKAYERPESEVTGNAADDYERRAPGTAGMESGVRYQFYETTDGHVLFMASEREFWKNFCEGVGRPDLFERWPGAKYGDHARGNPELRAILREIFAARSSAEWLAFGIEHNTPIAPSTRRRRSRDDPQFRDRMPWIPAECGRRHAARPDQVRRRDAARAHEGADGRPAHRRGAARGARLGRRPHRSCPRCRRARCCRLLTKETHQTDVRVVSLARDTTGATRSYDE